MTTNLILRAALAMALAAGGACQAPARSAAGRNGEPAMQAAMQDAIRMREEALSGVAERRATKQNEPEAPKDLPVAPPAREPMRMNPAQLTPWLAEDRFNPPRWIEAIPPPDFSGSITAWAEDGTRYSVSEFRNGLKHGEERFYYPDGALFRRWTFENGDAEGECTEWYADGKKALETKFRGGFRDGETSSFNEDGSMSATGLMRHGAKDGIWSNHLPGQSYPFAQETYANGVLKSQRVLLEPTLEQARQMQAWTARKTTHSHKALWDRYLAATRSAPPGIPGRLLCTAAWREVGVDDIEHCFVELDKNRDRRLDAEELRSGRIDATGALTSSTVGTWTPAEFTLWCRQLLGG